jgi:hypothetical protein
MVKPTRKPKTRAPSNELLFFTNRMNALPVLSSGLAQPAVGLTKVYEDFFSATPGRLPLWNGPCPSNLEELITGGRAEVYPVAFEVDRKRISIKSAPTLNMALEVVEALDGNWETDCRCVLPEMVIPICSMTRLHFRSDAELEDFLNRDFANIDMRVLPRFVSPDLFAGLPVDLDHLKASVKSIAAGVNITASTLRAADAAAGAAVLLANELPPRASWLKSLEKLLQSDPATDGPAFPAQVVRVLLEECRFSNTLPIDTSLDDRFLRAGLRYLLASRSTAGWVSGEFIESIRRSVASAASQAELKDLDAWSKYAIEVARAERQPNSLDDSRSTVRRALILLILRNDPERLTKSRSSALQPGDEVLALAATMCGAFYGYSMLPSSLKWKPACSTALPALVSEWVNRRAQLGCTAIRGLKIKASTAISEEQPPISKLSVHLGADCFAERIIQPPAALRRVYDEVKQLGFDLAHDWNGRCLRVQMSLKGERRQEVVISEGKPGSNGRPAIKFESLCMKLGRGGMKREQCVDLLKRNGSELHCRFGLSSDEQFVVVLHEQLLDTMDLEELRSHLEHVAQVADDFERENGLPDAF